MNSSKRKSNKINPAETSSSDQETTMKFGESQVQNAQKSPQHTKGYESESLISVSSKTK